MPSWLLSWLLVFAGEALQPVARPIHSQSLRQVGPEAAHRTISRLFLAHW